MRDIKFRAVDRLNRIVYGTGIFEDGINTWLLSHDSSKPLAFGFDKYIVDKDTITQYTGMKDISGKEIYEGDIVEADYMKTEVFFENGSFKLKYNNGHKLEIASLCKLDVDEYCLKVIGNIYEDKNLFK